MRDRDETLLVGDRAVPRPLLALGCLLLVGCAAAARQPIAGPHRLDGTLQVTAAAQGAGESLRWEGGAVSAAGRPIALSVEGLEAGTSGFSGLVVVGEVYDLERPEDLAGTYERVVADVDLGEEPGAALLGNEHGVLLVLRARDDEIPLGPARTGVVIQLAE
jgi:hypothetical protein